jgi:hypothetical protein
VIGQSDEQLKADGGEFLDRDGRPQVTLRQFSSLRHRDILLPISIAFAGACYAFQKCIVTYLVGDDLEFRRKVLKEHKEKDCRACGIARADN